jgi:hypothetical protein
MIRGSSNKLTAIYHRHNEYDVLTLQVKLDDGSEIVFFSGPIDKKKIADWIDNLLEHQDDEFPFDLKSNESLSSAVKRLYDELDPEINEDDFEKLYEYRSIHDLSLGNRGVDTPNIIIGNRKGQLTISKDDRNYQIGDLACLVR